MGFGSFAVAILMAPAVWAQSSVVFSGRVTDAVSGLPIEGAAVRILQVDLGSSGHIRFTDAGGTFSFDDVFSGATAIRISAQDYLAWSNPNDATIQITPDHAIHNFKLIPTGTIIGRITGFEDDQPRASLAVTLLKEDFTEGVRRFTLRPGALSVSTLVATDGTFRFSGLEPGRYIVRVAPGAGRIGLTNAKETATTQPTEGYTVSYYPGTTEFADALPVSLAAGETRPVDFQAPKRPLWRAWGEVDLPGVAGGDAGLFMGRSDGTGTLVSTRLAVPGPFVIDGLPAGEYDALLSVTGLPPPQSHALYTLIPTLRITDHDVGGLKLQPATRQKLEVQGSFRMSNGGPLPSGLSVNFAAREPGGISSPIPAGGGSFWLSTGPGDFSLQPVVPAGYAVESLRYGGFNYLNSLVPISGSTIDSSVEIVLTNRPAAISGKTEEPSARIVLVPDPVPPVFDFRSIRATTADTKGEFAFTGLTPGRYKVVALTGDDRRQDHDMSLLKDRLNKADTVEVLADQRANVIVRP